MTIENLGNQKVRINGPCINEYAKTDLSLTNIPYDGAITVYFITKINQDLTLELLDNKSPYMIIVHNVGDDIYTRNADSFEVELPSDGYYEITALVIPTVTFIEDGLGIMPGADVSGNVHTNIIAANINETGVSFYTLTRTNSTNEDPYQYMWANWKSITIDEILELIAKEEEANTLNSNTVTVQQYTKSAFMFDNLYACYIKRAQNLLNVFASDKNFCAEGSLCSESANKYKYDIQLRDYLWMAVNVISYCIQNGQYLKALKVLNCVSSCGNICKDTKSKLKQISQGCGCGK